MNGIIWTVWFFYGYMTLGALFAVYFVLAGAARIDASARGISWKTRALLFPGAAALWPVLLRKCLRPPEHEVLSTEHEELP